MAAEVNQSLVKAMVFLLNFRAEFNAREMPFETSKDDRELMFQWQGAEMKLTAMDNGYIMAGEKHKRCGIMTYDITTDRAMWLSQFIAAYRAKQNW